MADTGVLAWISVLLIAIVSASKENKYARGWGESIDWVSLEDGLVQAKEQNKPLMVIIHKTWCGACKALKPKFAEKKEIVELSKNFIMVNTEDDEEPSDSQYKPDGGYIPRILFVDPQGKVRKEFINEDGNAQYKYYYPSPDDIVKSMRRVAEAGPFSAKEDKKIEL